MADNFSVNKTQGVYGEFKPVIDESVADTVNSFQGVFGEFKPVLDEAAGVVAGSALPMMMQMNQFDGGQTSFV